jgi:exosortase A-associated hydrolase 1
MTRQPMPSQAHALRFSCAGQWLIGILELPDSPLPRGVLIVTGGPQYRVGSHRQFVLLARTLAAAGIPVMRFDYRGMGDSGGEVRDFEQVQADLESAVAHFFRTVPALRELVLWGLCDGASAAAFHAARDCRICGLVMLNPWVRTAQGQARTTLRHYYLDRLAQRDFWRKLCAGALRPVHALRAIGMLAWSARRGGHQQAGMLPQRMHDALARFRGRILIILSGADLTAREFSALAEHHVHWRALLAAPRVRQEHLPQANHTFARAAWRDQVGALCLDWIVSW